MRTEKHAKYIDSLCAYLHFKVFSKDFYKLYRYYSKDISCLLALHLSKQQNEKYVEQAKVIIENCYEQNQEIILWDSLEYPTLLKEISSPPLVLFIKGNKKLLQNQKNISIVGTRRPSVFSIYFTQFFVDVLSSLEFTIVSGMALGIDSVAHRTSLSNEKGSTISVLAHGLDYPYPRANKSLFELSENSNKILLLSEYPPGTTPKTYFFPKRNRLITGLSPYFCFIEGERTSGAMISAKYALDQNKEIYALDSKFMFSNSGGKQLIEDGALCLLKLISYQSISSIYGEPRNSGKMKYKGITVFSSWLPLHSYQWIRFSVL